MKRGTGAVLMALALVAALVLSGCELLRPTIDRNKLPAATINPAGSASASSSSGSASDESTQGMPVFHDKDVVGHPIIIWKGAAYPGILTIPVDASVTWINHDDNDHRIYGAGWDSYVIHPGQRMTRRFFRSGTFAWRSGFYPNCGGEIIVQ